MLWQLLQHIASGQSNTITSLAAKLHTTPAMITLLAERLVALGYLQESAPSTTCAPNAPSSAHCAGCSGCLLATPQRIWSVTEKGLRSAQTPR
ncbi:MAG: MarR family winged helix-turn-helix transcriptional regulator [Anaerolinea sp.]|nr:MarR family winged helix-turn-helix transcriptional regulator [Anaerolinea sp.]